MTTLTRRHAIGVVTGLLPVLAGIAAQGRTQARLLFVHGRAQGGRSEGELREEWMSALEEGALRSGHLIPKDLDVVFPFYGDLLDTLVAQFNLDLSKDFTTKGDSFEDDFLAFQAEVANEMRHRIGITDQQIDEIYGNNPREKGPQNWEWVQSIIKAIDSFSPNTTQIFLELFLRDVYIYMNSPLVRRRIDETIIAGIDDRPTIIAAHSLGTVVTYHILQNNPKLNVPLYFTIGSPLAIRAIRRRFEPLKHPVSVGNWLNAYDERDVVALYPLDEANFPITPRIENIGINNQTDNRHGISGYLDKASVAGRLLNMF